MDTLTKSVFYLSEEKFNAKVAPTIEEFEKKQYHVTGFEEGKGRIGDSIDMFLGDTGAIVMDRHTKSGRVTSLVYVKFDKHSDCVKTKIFRGL